MPVEQPRRGRCLSCRAPLAASAAVCPSCGEPTAAPERKLVTLLFADLTGYTEMCSRLDAEDVHNVVRPAMTALRQVVESYGGSVPQVQGDGFMAVFGAPTAHEDDAERAVRAALALSQAVDRINAGRDTGVRIPPVHIGVNSGEVLVAGSREAGGFSVAGDSVNVAARLCALAPGGRAFVSERTVELTGHAARYGPRRGRRVKGLHDLVPVYELLGLRAGVAPGVRPRSAPTFVGRAGLLELLGDIARDGAQSQVVLVRGDAGQGKTRLAEELVRRVAPVTVVRGACSPYGDRLPLAPLADALDLPALSGTPRADAATVRKALEALARKGSVVAILDDLHWAAPEVLDLVSALDREPAAGRVLVLGLTRPDASPPGVSRTVELGALSAAEMRALLADLLGGPPPVWLEDDLLGRAGGNPLFLDECVRMLVDDGTVRLDPGGEVVADRSRVRAVPNSMRMFIAARLDALPPAEKAVLQHASVSGGATWQGLLVALGGGDVADTVRAVEARGLLRERAGSSVPGEVEYGFKHALIRDVAYESLTRRERAWLHQVVAGWLARAASPSEPPAGLLAYHFTRAFTLSSGDAAGEGPSCELARQAVSYLGAWGRELFAHQARGAELAFSQGLDVAAAAPACIAAEVRAGLLVDRARALNEMGRAGEAADDARLAGEIATEVGVVALEAESLLAQSMALSTLGRIPRARALNAAAAAAFERAGDGQGRARTAQQAAETLRYDDLASMTRLLREAYDLYAAAGDRRGQAATARDLAFIASVGGGPEFRRWVARADELTDPATDLRGRAALHRTTAFYELYRGERTAALELARKARDDAAEAGALYLEADGLLVEQECLAALGRLDAADRVLGRLNALAEGEGTRRLRAHGLATASRTSARSRRPGLARRQVVEARRLLADLGERSTSGVDVAEAELLLDAGRFAEARPLAQSAVDEAETTGWVLFGLLPRILLARSAFGAGDDDAGDRLADAVDVARRVDAPRLGAFAAALLEQHQLLTGVAVSPSIATGDAELPETQATLEENDGLRHRRAGDGVAAAAAFARAATRWSTLGATVWLARALLWQAAAHGAGEEADLVREPVAALLADVDAPDDLATRLAPAATGG